MKYSKVIVLLCIAITTAYTLAALAISWHAGKLPPDSLTVAVFAMYSIEFGSMAAIKITDKRGDDAVDESITEDDDEDEEG